MICFLLIQAYRPCHMTDSDSKKHCWIKIVKFKIIKKRTGCQYIEYWYFSENLNWVAQNQRLGRMWPEGRELDIVVPYKQSCHC